MTKPVSADPTYRALALQIRTQGINALGVSEARESMAATIGRIGQQARAGLGWIGPDCRLIVLPEYVLTGFPMGEPIAMWRDKAAIAPDGPEYDQLGAIAQDLGVHLAVNAYETDRHFPNLYFQASVVIGPTGDVVLRYRRLHSLYSPSPHDVWDRYLEIYGIDAVFPVARTEIGNLAAVASEEILYPELARVLALRGAEVFLHSTSEVSSPDPTPKSVARRARAIENLAYVVSANSGGLTGISIPAESTNGGSEIIDFIGRPLIRAGGGESIVATAELDLGALRRERRRPGMGNLLSRVKSDVWSAEYARHDVDRANLLRDVDPSRSFFVERQRDVLQRLGDRRAIE